MIVFQKSGKDTYMYSKLVTLRGVGVRWMCSIFRNPSKNRQAAVCLHSMQWVFTQVYRNES